MAAVVVASRAGPDARSPPLTIARGRCGDGNGGATPQALSNTQRARTLPASVTISYSPSLLRSIERAVARSHSMGRPFKASIKGASTSVERTSFKAKGAMGSGRASATLAHRHTPTANRS